MKDYHQQEENATTNVNNTTNCVLGKDQIVEKGSGALAPNPFPLVGLLDTHVLQSPLLEKHDDFVEVSFREWEKWLNDYTFRRLQRNSLPPFTLTDFDENH